MRFLERLVFILLLFTFPIQLGKHFWPNYAFVQGIRVDYLAPTLYVSDILCLILFAVSFNRIRGYIWKNISAPWIIFLFIVISFGTFRASFPEEALYGLIKLLEFIFIAIYVSFFVKHKEYSLVLFPFILGSLVEVVIVFFQFIEQSSLGGAFYFLGERTFDPATPGIALFRLGSELILRSYGTFPHPNVLAFYLFCSFILILFSQNFNTAFRNNLKIVILAIIALGIVLTFSRVIIILTIASVFLSYWRRKKIMLLSLIFSCILLFTLIGRFENGLIRDMQLRMDLLKIAWDIFLKNPILGVGLNNFYYHEVFYQKSITPVLLQPVHNIYALWLCYVGILGFFPALYFIRKTIKRAASPMMIFLIFSLLLIGMLDHYMVTLQQGQLLLAFMLGIFYSELNSSSKV